MIDDSLYEDDPVLGGEDTLRFGYNGEIDKNSKSVAEGAFKKKGLSQYKRKEVIKLYSLKEDENMILAREQAEKSPCTILKVGAVLANCRSGNDIGLGFNDSVVHNGQCEYYDIEKQRLRTCDTVEHAEVAAIADAIRNSREVVGSTLYVTHSPCVHCAKIIASFGIKKVIYETEFFSLYGVNLLKELNVKVYKYEKSKD